MKTAIMQPYFLPYLGYFQLIAAVDRFVVYDTIQYTKKGWINRNRMLRNGEAATFTIPLQKGSDFLDVRDRQVAGEFRPDQLSAQIAGAYRKAPEFDRVMPLVEAILAPGVANLFDFVHRSIGLCCDFIGLTTPILVASKVEAGRSDRSGVDRVIDLCQRTGATTYVNPPGGRELYSADQFRPHGIALKFLQPRLRPYAQFGGDFVPALSILDVLMFNPADRIRGEMMEADLAD